MDKVQNPINSGKSRLHKHLPPAFPLLNGVKQRDPLSSENQEGLELNGPNQLLIFGHYMNLLYGNIST
jgi:hypothetical protein